MLVDDVTAIAGKLEPDVVDDREPAGVATQAPDDRLLVEAMATRFEAGDAAVWSWLRNSLLHEQEFCARHLRPGDRFPGLALPTTEAQARTAVHKPDWSVESMWWLDGEVVTVLVLFSCPSTGEVWSGLCRAPRHAVRGFSFIKCANQMESPTPPGAARGHFPRA
jgi:hypothetical protein